MNEVRSEKMKRLLEVEARIREIESNGLTRYKTLQESDRLKTLHVERAALLKGIVELPYELATLEVRSVQCFKSLDNRIVIDGSKLSEDGNRGDWSVEYKDGIPVNLSKFAPSREIENQTVKLVQPIKVVSEKELKERKEAAKIARAKRPKAGPLKFDQGWVCTNPQCNGGRGAIVNGSEMKVCRLCGASRPEEKKETNGNGKVSFLDKLRGKQQ